MWWPPLCLRARIDIAIPGDDSSGRLCSVKRGIVALLLVFGAYLCWWVVQRGASPALHVLTAEQGESVGQILARIAVLCFISALLSLLRPRWLPGMLRPPANWWRPLVLTASSASALLFLVYLGPWSIVALVIDAVLVWGVLAQGWTVATLTGS